MVHFIVSSDVNNIDISDLYKFADYHDNYQYFKIEKGEHYKLISYLAKQCPDNSILIDIGTYLGYSALALSINKNTNVITYDIQDCVLKGDFSTINDVSNIERRTKNCMEDMEELIKAPLIVLDVDPHDGQQEKDIINKLIEHKYKGIVLCDDIHLNRPMIDFWNWVPLKKIDLTKYGHLSGTGAIIFDPSVNDLELSDK
jgi:predicted O-methyltransferase YrrM